MFKSNEELDFVSKELCKFRIKNKANSALKDREDSIEILSEYRLQHLSTSLSQPNGFALNFMYARNNKINILSSIISS